MDYASLGRILHRVGHCLSSQGRFAEAQPWFQRAVESSKKGDVHGRVDYDSIGKSLHEVGAYLWRQGLFVEAQSWFHRAVEVKEQGDIHDRVDHDSLGLSLQALGSCLAKQNRMTEAQSWFQQATRARAKAAQGLSETERSLPTSTTKPGETREVSPSDQSSSRSDARKP